MASWTVWTGQMRPGWSVFRYALVITRKEFKRGLMSTCQVYSSDVTSVAVLFTLLLVAIFLFIYVIKQQILVVKFYGKSKLLEMHMNSVHQIEMK